MNFNRPAYNIVNTCNYYPGPLYKSPIQGTPFYYEIKIINFF